MTQLPPLPNGSLSIVIAGDQQGHEWINTFYAVAVTTATPTRAQLDALATALLNSYQLNMRPQMVNNVNINSCEVGWQAAPDSVIPGLAISPLAGTRTGSALPAQVCAVVNWHTSYDHYRGGHGRSYIPAGVTTDLANQTTWTAGFQTSMTAKATSWRGAINAYAVSPFTSLTMSRVTRIRDHQPIDPPVLRPITAETTRLILGTQRRRLI